MLVPFLSQKLIRSFLDYENKSSKKRKNKKEVPSQLVTAFLTELDSLQTIQKTETLEFVGVTGGLATFVARFIYGYVFGEEVQVEAANKLLKAAPGSEVPLVCALFKGNPPIRLLHEFFKEQSRLDSERMSVLINWSLALPEPDPNGLDISMTPKFFRLYVGECIHSKTFKTESIKEIERLLGAMVKGDEALTLPIHSDAIHKEIEALGRRFLGRNGYNLESLQQKSQRLYQAIYPSYTSQGGVQQDEYSTASMVSDSSSNEEHEEEKRIGKRQRMRKVLEGYAYDW